MQISERLKARFCKDYNILIKIYKEPYFTDRLILFDKFYNTLEKWNIFIKEMSKYKSEQDYLEEYNSVKDVAISSIKNSKAYQQFNNEDMNIYKVSHLNLPSNDIFKTTNDKKIFVSIDMKKANFSSLHYYNNKIFNEKNTWEEFISSFTTNEHIIHSKYIRQVILGNCNPKRHITYEKYLMDQVLTFLEQNFVPIQQIVFFSNDEIVIDVTNANYNMDKVNKLQIALNHEFTFPLKVEMFKLHKIQGTDGYYKEIYTIDNETNIEFKCLDGYIVPFVLRYFMNEEVTESDKVFYSQGLMSKFIETPYIEVN